MRLKSYLVDVRSAAERHWWVPTIALPMAAFGGLFLLYGLERFSDAVAVTFMTYYALVCLAVLACIAIGQTLWSWIFDDDPDHLVP